MRDPKLLAAAESAYLALYRQWMDPENTNWWANGNILDSLVDYLVLTHASPKALEDLALAGLQVYYRTNGMWYDDNGWWGGSACRGFLKRPRARSYLFGRAAPIYQAMAINQFKFMALRAPYAWDFFNDLHDGNPPSDYEPRYTGGVWNFILDESKVPSLSAVGDLAHNPDFTAVANPPYPTTNDLTSRQNSVTNGLYHLLGCRLCRYVQDDSFFSTSMETHTEFLNQWFQDTTDVGLIYRPQPQQAWALIRERVGCFKNMSPDPKFNPEVAWGGDQGLFLSALVDHQAAFGAPLTTAITPRQIVDGVFSSMAVQGSAGLSLDSYKRDNQDKISPMEDWDYSCGSGVFLRYLTYTYPQDETVRSAITDERKDIIANTAADPPFSGNNVIFKALDKLAAYNALLVMSA